MIARVWKGRTAAKSAAPYLQHLQQAVFPGLHRVPGYRGARVLCRDLEDRVEFVVTTHWESVDAIQGFAGEDVETAVVPPAAQALLVEWESRARHFNVVLDEDVP